MKQISLMAALLFLSLSAYAECNMPAAPAIPDGATSTEAQMTEGQGLVKAYMDKANEFIACLGQEARQAGDTDTPEAEAARTAAHNNAVDQMNVVAEGFNTSVREWKAATGAQ